MVRYAYQCKCGHVGEENSSCGDLEGREVLCSQCGRLAPLSSQGSWATPMTKLTLERGKVIYRTTAVASK